MCVCSGGIYSFQASYKAKCTNSNIKGLACSFNVICCRVPLGRSTSSSITFKCNTSDVLAFKYDHYRCSERNIVGKMME